MGVNQAYRFLMMAAFASAITACGVVSHSNNGSEDRKHTIIEPYQLYFKIDNTPGLLPCGAEYESRIEGRYDAFGTFSVSRYTKLACQDQERLICTMAVPIPNAEFAALGAALTLGAQTRQQPIDGGTSTLTIGDRTHPLDGEGMVGQEVWKNYEPLLLVINSVHCTSPSDH